MTSKSITNGLLRLFALPIFFIWYGFVLRRKIKYLKKLKSIEKPRLVWGPIPLISNKYWSNALEKKGYYSVTLMVQYFANINKKDDYDLYVNDLPVKRYFKGERLQWFYFNHFLPYAVFLYAIGNFDIFHHHFCGGYLGNTPIWKLEALLLKWAGCKTIITGYGADYTRYSRVTDVSLRYALLAHYPSYAMKESEIEKRVSYWLKNADIIINGFQVDSLGRWDIFPYNMVTIDVNLWEQKKTYSNANGKNKPIRIIHTPNHRIIKGTEYLIKAIDELKNEGYKIDLLLIEKQQNEYVRKKMATADILVEQLLLGYALSAIEGMACGLPVLSNLSNESLTRPFRRYSYLNECPILSTTPENIKENLKILIKNPRLRKRLGQAGRQYVEKYHSDRAAQYIFGKIYEKIWYKKDIDLINLFHPLLSKYNSATPIVKHGLIDNSLYTNYYKQ